jgi:hypothetical protein
MTVAIFDQGVGTANASRNTLETPAAVYFFFEKPVTSCLNLRPAKEHVHISAN